MHSVLLVINEPTSYKYEIDQAWKETRVRICNHLKNIKDSRAGSKTQKLGEHVLLIDLKRDLNLFVSLASFAQESGLSYQVLFLEQEPDWIRFDQ